MDTTHNLQSRLGGWATTTVVDARREKKKKKSWTRVGDSSLGMARYLIYSIAI